MENDNLKNEIINISDKTVTIKEVVDYLIKYSGKDIRVNYNDEVSVPVKNRIADLSKLNKLLPLGPNIGILKGMERTYDFIKENEYVTS